MKKMTVLLLLHLFLVQACSQTSTNKPPEASGDNTASSVEEVASDDEAENNTTGTNAGSAGADEPVTPDNSPGSSNVVDDPLCISTGLSVSGQTPVRAVIATTAVDFSSGAHAIVTSDSTGELTALNNLVPTASDITVATYGEHFYRIERAFAGNNITKFSFANPQLPVWQFSVNDPASAVLSNPHDMVFVSETKAYVLRYGSTKAWIVNPSATQESDFKIGELDLSAYGGVNGIPDMDSAVIANGKLFITLQRLEGPSFQPDNVSYVAVFDITTDQEIDAGISGDTLKGIPLLARNPTNILYDSNRGKIYVQSSGSTLPPLKYVSGIETIDVTTYASELILDDGDETDHPYGVIYQIALASSDVLYFVGYDGFRNNTLYVMDLETSRILPSKIGALISGDIASLATDALGRIWVGDNANASIRVIDTLNCEEVVAVSTNLNPAKIVFAQ